MSRSKKSRIIQIAITQIVQWFRKSDVWHDLAFPTVVGLGFLIRVVRFLETDLIFDEGYTVLAVRGVIEHLVPRLPSGIIYPRGIVYTYISAIFSLILGNEIAGIRLVSVLAGVGSIVGIYLLAKELFKKQELAVLAATLMAFSPFEIEVSRYGRFYSLMQFGFIFAVYFVTKLLHTKSKKALFHTIVGIVGFSALTIFSDSLGVGVLVPIFVLLGLTIYRPVDIDKILGVLKRKSSKTWSLILRGIGDLWDKNWQKLVGVLLPVLVFAVLQYLLERKGFYSTYRQIADLGDASQRTSGLPISVDPLKFLTFALSLVRRFWMEGVAIVFSLIFIKFNAFKINKEEARSLRFVLLSLFGFFVFVVLIAPQFQIRFFYIFYALSLVILAFVVDWLEQTLDWKGLVKASVVICALVFLALWPVWRIWKQKGSFVNANYLVSSSLDYFPDSKRAFEVAADGSTKDTILLSTYRKEVAYYPRDFEGMRYIVVPWALENSLESMPLSIYESRVDGKYRRNLTRETEFLIKHGFLLEDLLIDPVTGNLVLRPEDVLDLVSNSDADIRLVTSRFDYNENYSSVKYIRFLMDSKDRVIYRGEDEGYSDVYRF